MSDRQKKLKKKVKRIRRGLRLPPIPPNKKFKLKKKYTRKTKVVTNEVES